MTRFRRTSPHLRPQRRAARLAGSSLVTHLYECYAADIGAYALRRAAHADAADVVADTFLVAWRRHDEIPAPPDELPWLYGIARRVLSNQRRSRRRRTQLHDRLRSEFVELAPVGRDIEHAEHFQQVAAAFDRLSPTDAELLRLTAWEALTPTEIATAMELDPAAVRQRLRRARLRLRRELPDTPPITGASTTDADDSAHLTGWSRP